MTRAERQAWAAVLEAFDGSLASAMTAGARIGADLDSYEARQQNDRDNAVFRRALTRYAAAVRRAAKEGT